MVLVQRGVGDVGVDVGETGVARIVALGREANHALGMEIGAERFERGDEPVQPHMALAAVDEVGRVDIALHDDVGLAGQRLRVARYRHVLPAGAAARLGDVERAGVFRGVGQKRLAIPGHQEGRRVARRPRHILRAAQRLGQLRLAGELGPAGMVDGIVAFGQQAGDAGGVEPIDRNQFAEEAVGGDGEAAVAQHHRHAAQRVRDLEVVALQLRRADRNRS